MLQLHSNQSGTAGNLLDLVHFSLIGVAVGPKSDP
jgi:hypothetical protein